LWAGANRTFRIIPHQKRERERFNKPRSSEDVQRSVNSLIEREEKLRVKLKELGIEYDFAGYVRF
jgi:hypothetical protein